jgi:hypothetical protein
MFALQFILSLLHFLLSMKFKEPCGEVGSCPTLVMLLELGEKEGVGVWTHFQLDTGNVPVFFQGHHLCGLR